MPTNLQEFTEIFERLEVVYGVKDEKTIKVYWERLKKFEPWVIRRAVNRTLDDSDADYFPKLAFIVKTATYIRDQEYNKHKRPTYCSKCESQGLVVVTIKEDGKEREVAYRCDCLNGEKCSKKIASIKELNGKADLKNNPASSERLPQAEYKELIGHPEKMFKGILIKSCKKCGNHYYVRYEKEIMVRELMETHQRSIGLCDPCYIEKGRKMGLWE